MKKLVHFTAVALLLAVAGCAAPPTDGSDPKALMKDPAFRAFFYASPAEKVATVRAHYERMAARPGLTEAQRAAILGLRATVSEVGFGPHNAEWEKWAMRDGHEVDDLRAAFGDDLESIHDVMDTIE
jgi:hypothetical protein